MVQPNKYIDNNNTASVTGYGQGHLRNCMAYKTKTGEFSFLSKKSEILGYNDRWRVYLIRPETPDDDHLLEITKLFRPGSGEWSSVRLFAVIDLTPFVCVTHKTLPVKSHKKGLVSTYFQKVSSTFPACKS